MTTDDALSGSGRLGLDADVIIYFVQAVPAYEVLLTDIFGRIAQGELQAITSTITLTETFVLPFRDGNALLEQSFRDLLLNSANVTVLPVDAAIAERAADLRARYRMKTPDALQAATALEAGCQAFLTNNGDHFRNVTELNVLVLDELET